MYIRCIDTVFKHLFPGKETYGTTLVTSFASTMSTLARVGRSSYVSQRGLAEVLHEIQTHGLPSATSRSSVKRSRDADLEACANMYGKVLLSRELETEGKGNSKQTFPFVNPLAFVQHCLTECQPFRDYFIKYILPFGQDPASPIEKLEFAWL